MDEKLTKSALDFISLPNAQHGFAVIKNSKKFLLSHLSKWDNSNLTPAQKLKELMTEMFLILMEDFNPEKVSNPVGILAYISLKLRRLTKPYKQKSLNFGLAEDFDDLGRTNFSPSKISIIDEIVRIIRFSLANEPNKHTALLEFMFIHIFPEVAWASRALSLKNKTDLSKQKEADKKRHRNFNQRLKNNLKKIESADWKEVLTWSTGERSHLAWRIIQISQIEVKEIHIEQIAKLESIRENFDPKGNHNSDCVDVSEKLLSSIRDMYQTKEYSENLLNEEPVIYGEEEDILDLLISPNFSIKNCSAMNKSDKYLANENIELLFENASTEVYSWLKGFFDTPPINKEKPRHEKNDTIET